MSTIRTQFPLSLSGGAQRAGTRAAPSRPPSPLRGTVRHLLTRLSASHRDRVSFSRQLYPYRVEADVTFFELAHCPKCGTDVGVFRRRWPYGLVCRDCAV